jgi:3-hydroxybutyryl-CoA dehydrogenase
MRLIVLGNDSQAKELLYNMSNDGVDVTLTDAVEESVEIHADAMIDLLFDGSTERIELLKNFSGGIVIVNSVVDTLQKIAAPFTRINGWPGFLHGPIIEASTDIKTAKNSVENIFTCLGKQVEWVPDTPGFITARVIAMIINEAWYALDENVSTREEIDAAMRLGTNYPHGPFEWCDKIGIKNVYVLLSELSKMDRRYHPNVLLTKQATN